MISRATGTLLAGVAVAVAIASAGPGIARGEATWRLEQPPPPAGAAFKVPLGTPDDMQFYAPNEGLLSVEGNATVPAGLFFWNGRDWHQLSTVCGAAGEASRIAWAGPDDFWVITEPSEPRSGAGLGLCHFEDGVIVGSYSTSFQSPEPFRPMDAAACDGPDDCWFAGIGSEEPSGQHIGAYHLHWNGTSLAGSYQPQGRGVSGLASFDGTFYESTFVGAEPGNPSGPVALGTPEPDGPVLIHKLVGETFLDTGFLPYAYQGVPPEGVELLSTKADATSLWFSGGGAASGPAAPHEGSAPSPPIAVYYDEPFFIQDAIDPSLFGSEDRFVDIAPVPGTDTAWAADRALLGSSQHHREGEGRAGRTGRRRKRQHAAGIGSGARQRPARSRHRTRRSLDGDLGGVAVSLHERHGPARRHRPQLGRDDHLAPERVGRTVRPDRAPAG